MPSPVSSASTPADADAITALNAEERARILAKAALFSPPSPVTADGRRDIVGLSREELTEILLEIGEKPFRTKQLWHWIYHQGVTDFSLMSSIAKPLQQKLAEKFIIARPEASTVQTSQDETRKFLFRFRDGQEAETVYIPDRREDRGAVCISSQVAARYPAHSAIPAPKSWSVIWGLRKSWGSSWLHGIPMANGQAPKAIPLACSPPLC